MLGKLVTVAQQTLDHKVISYACICVEIDLNNPLPESLEIYLGSSSWVQSLDYESMPFRCRVCHEYGHIQWQCPKVNKNSHSNRPSPSSLPKEAEANTEKAPKSDADLGKDKEGFVPIKSRARNHGQKRSFRDRQTDEGLNQFEVLNSLALEEGIPMDAILNKDLGSDSHISHNTIVVHNPHVVQDQNVTMDEPLQDDMVLVDWAKAVCDRSKDSSHSLGVQQHPLKKGSFAPSSTVGRKKDHEKIKFIGDLLVESGSVKTINAHFSPSPPRFFSLGIMLLVSGISVSVNALALMMDVLALVDVKPSNGIFTWNNRWSGEEAIFERLDRFLVSCFWVGDDLVTISEILDWKGSDHWPIKFSASSFLAPKNPPFKFQLMWLQDSSLHDLVAKWWREGGPSFGTAMKRSALECLVVITHQIWGNGFSDALRKEKSRVVCNVEEWELREDIF
ncbi:uncharacterized protein LOC131859988 [Cryptomeria japonica]|uniref:uncharacterized protein LOC131859988 n=1 Tax=Cryptomeria japonica TaxID=3369 RepID=UPI0027DA31F3|nr:uncharacterized protein LOC131859988 [Cryptomeria japonica]